jgi:PTH1 family peptidyl-tRNA hydrolase
MLFGKIKIDDVEFCIAKPQTFMNLSGYAVAEIVNYFKINVENVLVVHDDIDMALGKIKFVKKSGAGGHNGVSSIINEIGDSFYRLKLGISRPEGEMEVSDYVLAKVGEMEKPLYEKIVKVAADAVESFYKNGPEEAMQKYNNSLVSI